LIRLPALVGYTGFVGSNLMAQYDFQQTYNSKNIAGAYGLKPDLLVYAGVAGTKFIANGDPAADRAIIADAAENIRRIAPEKIVLISTIDVYPPGRCGYESDRIDYGGQTDYGLHRLQLEKWVAEHIKDHHIIRLPGIYGRNLKKNLIFDLIYGVFPILKLELYERLRSSDPFFETVYRPSSAGHYYLHSFCADDLRRIRRVMNHLEIDALQYTDSRGIYQYYDLKNLWKHIRTAVQNEIRVLNIAPEPISAKELVEFVTRRSFRNHKAGPFPRYDMKTSHAALFQMESVAKNYIGSRSQVLKNIKEFVHEQKNDLGLPD
jgi:nucleoside-diphosphate-sugar epimerase